LRSNESGLSLLGTD